MALYKIYCDQQKALHLSAMANIMVQMPSVAKVLAELGVNIRAARLRRRLSASQVAERAGITRQTVYAIEKGIATVAMGNYARVLFALGLEKDLLGIAEDDVLGRKLQDARLLLPKRAPRRPSSL